MRLNLCGDIEIFYRSRENLSINHRKRAISMDRVRRAIDSFYSSFFVLWVLILSVSFFSVIVFTFNSI